MTVDPTAPPSLEARARRAYEWGLARDGLVRALIVLGLSVLAARVAGVALRPLTLALVVLAWTFLGWRRGWWLRGAQVGLLGGLAALLLPMSLLCPCCPPGMMVCENCCARPGTCALAGLALGVVMAALLPRRGDGGQRARRHRDAAGRRVDRVGAVQWAVPGRGVGHARRTPRRGRSDQRGGLGLDPGESDGVT